MKFSASPILVIALSASGAFSHVTQRDPGVLVDRHSQKQRDLEAEIHQRDVEFCGDLGVMDRNNTPEGVDPAQMRRCVEHPIRMSFKRDSSVIQELNKRECYYGTQPLGCKNGYCWKRCDGADGAWCWQAKMQGYGDWTKCSGDYDCFDLAGYECAKSWGKACTDCGCSC